MIVAYSCPPNLANLLSYRKIANCHGPPVLSYLTRDSDRASFIRSPIWRESKEGNERSRERSRD
eukprot:11728994-Ditylum_brightwellii.AAC.1